MIPSLKKRYGQHHLRRGELCRPLVDFLAPAGERVVEIGPGAGVLSAELLAAGARRVLACEVDPEWAFYLRRRLPEVETAVIDALHLDWRRLRKATLVGGNLPFQISTRLILRLLAAAATRPGSVPRAAFLVQKEVAERLAAGPNEPAYGSLSVLAAALAEVRRLGTVAPGSFRPPPKVAAAFVGLLPRPAPVPAAELPELVRLVRLAFAHRRKTLRNALAAGWGRRRAEDVLREVGLEPRRRAESLAVADFLELHAARRRIVSRLRSP